MNNGKTILSLTSVLAAVCAIAALRGEEPPKFETASVKLMERGVIYNSMGPGMVTLRGNPLNIILMEAFKVKTYQMIGPSWLSEDCFEIIAKMPAGATTDQIPAMLQSLLAERFKLVARKEDRPLPVYALVVDKGGPKFKEADKSYSKFGLRPGAVMIRAGASTRGFKGAMTVARLAQFLSGKLDRPVQDLTGLTGTYDIDLSWAPDPGIDRPSQFAAPDSSGDPPNNLPAAPTASIFTAIRDSLGLKLEARKGTVEVLVIDHVERVPTEN